MLHKNIDPKKMTTEEAEFLGDYLAHHQVDSLQLKLALIADKKNSHGNIKSYYVISNDPSDKHEGGFTSVRKIIGNVSVDTANPHPVATFQSRTGKVVRIKNPNFVQRKNLNENKGYKYKHKQAIAEYLQAKEFDHMEVEEPIKVKKAVNKPGFPLGFFSKKSYMVMNEFPGTDILSAVIDLANDLSPGSREMLELVVIPLLEAYQLQIANKGKVHRDIKPPNVLAAFGRKTEINFIDVDESANVGVPDKLCGTPGFVAPECKNPETLVSQARDIFSLGVLIYGLFNDKLDPRAYFRGELGLPDQEVRDYAIALIEKSGFYDPSQMPDLAGNTYDIFQFMNDNLPGDQAVRDVIQNLLKRMTAADPNQRPRVDTIISELKKCIAPSTPLSPPLSPIVGQETDSTLEIPSDPNTPLLTKR